MDIEYSTFGTIVVDGKTYDHDVIIEDEHVKKRDKGPSKPLKGRYGHTPLSVNEGIPWSGPTLVIGSGYSGRLPILPEIEEEAKRRGIDLLVMPTAEAVGVLNEAERPGVNAILHVTC